jgi:hypothetical protein
MLYAMYHQRSMEVANAGTQAEETEMTKTLSMTIGKAHHILGHGSEDATRKTTKALGWTITRGALGACQACTEAKANQKNLPRHLDQPPSTRNDQRIYLDIATVCKTKKGSKVSKGNWCLMVHERTGLKFSDFYDTKNELVELTCEHFNRWKRRGKPVKYVRGTRQCG